MKEQWIAERSAEVERTIFMSKIDKKYGYKK